MSNGQIPYDDNNKPVLALWNDATGQAIPAHVKSTVTGADGKTYGILDTGSSGGGGGAVTDLVASGTITAAQPTEGTAVANATVVLALGTGQATWEAQITGLGTGSTVAFDGVDDSGVSTNWEAAVGYQSNIINPPPITSIAGPGPFIIRGTSSGYQQIRVRCTVYNGTDTIAVRLLGSVGSLAGAGGLVSNDGTFAKESGGNLAAAKADLDTIVTQTASLATHADAATLHTDLTTTNSDLSTINTTLGTLGTQTTLAQVKSDLDTIVTNTNKIPASPAQEGGNLATVATNTGNIPAKGANTTANSTPVNIASDQVVPVKRSAVAVYSLPSTAETVTGNSGDLTVGPYTEISIDIDVTAGSGAGATVQFFWDRKGADGVYYPIWQSVSVSSFGSATQISTSIGAGMAYNQSLALTGRLRWVIGGTGPSITFSANVAGK